MRNCAAVSHSLAFSSVQLHFWQEISSEVTFFGQLGPAEVADILSGVLAGGRGPLARSENQDEVAFRFHWAQSSMTHTGNRAEMEDIENPNLFLFQNVCISTQEDGIYCRLSQLSVMEEIFKNGYSGEKKGNSVLLTLAELATLETKEDTFGRKCLTFHPS